MSAGEVPVGLRSEITRTLEVGVVIACLLLLLGIGLSYGSGAGTIHATASRISIESLPSSLERGDGQAFLLLGALALVLTPVARVLLSLVTFARGNDAAFTGIVLYVLVVLLLSLAIGVLT